jgi:exopolysaccharide production protein ExoY
MKSLLSVIRTEPRFSRHLPDLLALETSRGRERDPRAPKERLRGAEELHPVDRDRNLSGRISTPVVVAPKGLSRDAGGPVLGGSRKRAMDLTIASLVLLLAAPLMALVSVLIKLTMGGPIIFGHPRIGRNGSSFRCYKFRTMIADGEEVLTRRLQSDPQAAREWSETRKLRNDPRVTILGQVLRKSSLDELPQLINVLRGEMSCVGPRPVVKEELERYGSSAEEYLKCRPGLTGIWQVSGRNKIEYAHRVTLDSYYVRTWSLWLDLVILVKTIPALLTFDETS